MLHSHGSLVLSDLHFERRPYSPSASYSQSKLANVLFAKQLADICAEAGFISVVSLHPGVIHTNLVRHIMDSRRRSCLSCLFDTFIVDKTIPQGAATTLWACLSDECNREITSDKRQDHPGKGQGQYLSDCHVVAPSTAGADVSGVTRVALWKETNTQLDAALDRLCIRETHAIQNNNINNTATASADISNTLHTTTSK